MSRVPVRTCVACREEAPKSALIRLARTPAGVALDPAARLPGRGAYLHPTAACAELARKRRSLERALRTPVPDALWTDMPWVQSVVLPDESP